MSKRNCQASNYEIGRGTSLVVQWLRLHALSAGGRGSIPSQGTKSCVTSRVHMLQLKILYAATKTQGSKIN